jgi:hypothetical protein
LVEGTPVSDELEVAPYVLAQCDQEIAQGEEALNLFVALWKQRESERDVDRVHRISYFMALDLMPQCNLSGLVTLLTIAIERLSKEDA